MMNLEGIRLSEISQRKTITIYSYMWNLKTHNTQAHGHREQIGGYQREGMSKMSERGQRVQIPS